MTTETTALQTIEGASTDMMVYDEGLFNQMYQVAGIIANGQHSVPDAFRGNQADCMAVVVQSKVWGINPFAVIQKSYVVGGKIGYESQLINTVINKFGPIKHRLEIEHFGDWNKIVGLYKMKTSQKGKEYAVQGWDRKDEEGLGVRIKGILNGENEPRVLELLLKQCHPRNSTLWAYDPKQQIAYLGQRRWARLYTPDVILGVYTKDELMEWDLTVDSLPVEDEEPENKTITIEEEPDRDAPADPETMAKLHELIDDPALGATKQSEWKAALEKKTPTQHEAEKSIGNLTFVLERNRKAAQASAKAQADQKAAEPAEAPQEAQEADSGLGLELPDEDEQQRETARRRMHALGIEVHGKEKWDSERAEMVKRVDQNAKSSNDLSLAGLHHIIGQLETLKNVE